MNYRYLLAHPQLFPSAIGITYKQFELLLPKFSSALRRAEHKKAYEKERVRIPGGGRKPKLATDRQKLFFILFYYKTYPTFRFAQIVFELSCSNVFYWKEFLELALFEALGYQLDLPLVRVRSLTGWLAVCPQLREFIIDATERPIRRPKDAPKQKAYYSGKKKRHTVKNQILVNPRTRKILYVSRTVEGKLHDKRLLEKEPIILQAPPGAKGVADLGYQGAGRINPLVRLIIPIKKPPHRRLSLASKKTNKAISSLRVRVEHSLSYLKHFAILSHQFRNRIEKAHQPMMNLACLYNFTRTHH